MAMRQKQAANLAVWQLFLLGFTGREAHNGHGREKEKRLCQAYSTPSCRFAAPSALRTKGFVSRQGDLTSRLFSKAKKMLRQNLPLTSKRLSEAAVKVNMAVMSVSQTTMSPISNRMDADCRAIGFDSTEQANSVTALGRVQTAGV